MALYLQKAHQNQETRRTSARRKHNRRNNSQLRDMKKLPQAYQAVIKPCQKKHTHEKKPGNVNFSTH